MTTSQPNPTRVGPTEAAPTPASTPANPVREEVTAAFEFSIPFGDERTLLADFECLRDWAAAYARGLRLLTQRGWKEHDSDGYRDDSGRSVTGIRLEREHVTDEQALAELDEARQASAGWLDIELEE